jgi:Tfp pilus assembly protein PilN
MRPVNLIPLEDRRGEKRPLRTGPLAYVVVGVLAVALLGTILVVTTGNQISQRKAQVASLQSQVTQTQSEAQTLQPFTNFASMQQARDQTVASLATSRFDWERVLRELAIVIPGDVWLTNLSANSAGAASSASGSGGSSGAGGSAATITGPSLDIEGCATGHDAVAGFLAALRDIDGVTRVTVMSSDRDSGSGSTDQGSSGGTGASGDTGSGSSSASCASRSFISTFDLVVAFDNAQPGAAEGTSSSGATTPTTTAAAS